MSLREMVLAQVLLAQAGDPVDPAAIREVCVEGRDLAESMEDDEALTFFNDVLSQLG
jgi:hypothetical protein